MPVMQSGSLQIAYEGFFGVRTNGNDSTYSQGLTHRYVNGELRFLLVTGGNTAGGRIHEFRPAAPGQTQTTVTRSWQMPSGSLSSFVGIWFEQAKNRLWVTTTTAAPARPMRAFCSACRKNGA